MGLEPVNVGWHTIIHQSGGQRIKDNQQNKSQRGRMIRPRVQDEQPDPKKEAGIDQRTVNQDNTTVSYCPASFFNSSRPASSTGS